MSATAERSDATYIWLRVEGRTYSMVADEAWLLVWQIVAALANRPSDTAEEREPILTQPGMVTVYDDAGVYVGCMGRHRWERLLREDGPKCNVWADTAEERE